MEHIDEQLPRISIIVPSFNQARFLGEALESIFRQGYPRLEVVVMDGGSSDESMAIIQSYESRLKYWQSQPDGGQSAAINAGVQHCTGDLVAWLNSDDFYWGDSLWTVGRAYITFPGHGLYIGNGFRFPERENRLVPFCDKHMALNRTALTQGLDYILQPSTFFARSAWHEVNGLDPSLRFCMDWDIILRIARRYPAVLINEFLAVSREYGETKTSTGGMRRALEIIRVVQAHSGQEYTPGSLFYLLETLINGTEGLVSPHVRQQLYNGISAIEQQFVEQYGHIYSFPDHGDPQDHVYLPFAADSLPRRSLSTDQHALPSISIITPSFNQAQFLGQTLESILNQEYPKLETLVFDGCSTDGSLEVLRRYQERLTYSVSEPDRGPADAINKGLKMATGEVLAWLNSDDMLTCDALWEVARAFADDPDLDMVYANALYINEENQLHLVNHGTHHTGLYFGEIQPLGRVPAYWSYVHAIPQPTVFFRRRLLETCGYLDESFQYIFDFELFWRFAWKAKIKKLERTQAFYRIHAASKTSDWNKFLVELYSFSRPWWPPLYSREFRTTFRDFLSSYMRRRFGKRPRDIWFWGIAALVGLSVLTRIGNPEALRLRLPRARILQPPEPSQITASRSTAGSADLESSAGLESNRSRYHIERTNLRYRSFFCSYHWPRHPGHSGGEIRDFHLLRRLLTISHVEVFASVPDDDREDPLAPFVDALHSYKQISEHHPHLVDKQALRRSLKSRITSRLRRLGVPVVGPRYHLDAAWNFAGIVGYVRGVLQEALDRNQPDFLFVSPQSNPVALTLRTDRLRTRLIMASYDVEAVRVRRIAASHQSIRRLALDLEVPRARRFEHENLALYDGIIAVSELDRRIFIEDYGFPPARVLVIENGVDIDYFAFHERQPSQRQEVVFVGSLSYLPNQQAAWRLHHRIMPFVRQRYPTARLWIVGQGPDVELLAQSDVDQTIITGKVDDVRPYLARATVACVPLLSGSGTKYKVLEALGAGVPLVCSPLAIEGLALEAGKHVLLGHSDQDIATAIVRLLDDPKLAATLARQGRNLIERCYAWEANLARLDDWLDQLIALPRRKDEAQASAMAHYAKNGSKDCKEAPRSDTILELDTTTIEGGEHHD